MKLDKLLKRKEITDYISIGDTKLRELIKKDLFIKPVKIQGFKEDLYSLSELQNWISEQKEKRI
ncbi:helix-turn-helix transcriptional regulator [Arcobacter sp. YIC-464]|uniref:helix-turn-helix transcriptional regulator n=1 Tax=Arcobacter sp. YIC-464 TaxID=3376631 RepID=UPI003C24DC3E